MIKEQIIGTLRSYTDLKTSKKGTVYRTITMSDSIGTDQSSDVFEILLFGKLAQDFKPKEINCSLIVDVDIKGNHYETKIGTIRYSSSFIAQKINLDIPTTEQPNVQIDEDVPF